MNDYTVQGQPRNAFDAYLFDIDGTLLNCTDAVHYFAFCEALGAVAGRAMTLEGVVTQGNVDVGILRDALARADVPESAWRPRLAEMRDSMCRYVDAHKDEFRANVLPGVRALLEHLHAKGALLGTATGNLEAIGRAKLRHTGLLQFFTVGGWSDAYETRTDVFRGAVAQMRAMAGAESAICVLGDTPADILAASANGLPVIAVATGVYSFEELQSASADLLLRSFEDLLPPG